MGLRELKRALIPQWLRELRRRWRARRKMQGVRRAGAVDADRLLSDLRALGLEEGDLLMVHSAMSRLGHLERGADTVIDALQACVGESGTLVLPTFSLTGPMSETLSDPSRVFDPDTTPSTMGRITETFRQRPGVVRSVHPTHSVAAWGREAAFIARRDDSLLTNFGADSALGRVLERGGKIVGLGIDFGPVTFYHVAEDLRPELFPEVYLSRDFVTRVLVDGRPREVRVRCHDPAGHARRIDHDAGVERAFAKLFAERGLARRGPVGAGTGWWMPARGLVDAILELKEAGISIYGEGIPEEGIPEEGIPEEGGAARP